MLFVFFIFCNILFVQDAAECNGGLCEINVPAIRRNSKCRSHALKNETSHKVLLL